MGNLIEFPRNPHTPFKGASATEAFGHSWLTFTGTADEEILPNLETLRARSRYLCNNDVCGGVIENITTNVIGAGLRLDVLIDPELLCISADDANKWGRDVERRFRVWAGSPDPDIENKRTFYTIQRNAFRSMLIDGDAIAILTNFERMGSISSLRVNTIDSARVCSSYSSSGINKDNNGMPVSMSVKNADKSYRNIDIYHTSLGLRNIVHSYLDVLIGQSRGMPFIQSIIARMRKLEKYSDAELSAAVITSMLVLAFKKAPSNGGMADGLKEALLAANGAEKAETKRDIPLTEGTSIDLAPGEEIQSIKSDRPNSGYQAFIDALWREISIALNIPYEILVKQFGRSYSASRGAMHEFFKYVLSLREQFASEFVQPIYERWLFEEVAEGRIEARGYLTDPFLRRLWSAARWVGPPRGMLDENKEAQAAATRIKTRISTRKKEIANIDGGSIDDVHNQLLREKEMDKNLGLLATDSDAKEIENADVDD